MSEPQRSESSAEREDTPLAHPAVQIERLLLSGLDLYFAGQYQDAINVWTRVAFLERGHGRARAYIERARSAIAEQQRESDELLHRGRQAYEQGDVDRARQILTRAVEQSAASDDAILLLQQLNRFAPQVGAFETTPLALGPDAAALHAEDRNRWRVVVGAIAAVSALALGAAPLVSWFGGAPVAGGPAESGAMAPEPLPILRTGESAYGRARELYAGGRLADALRVLDRIDVGDPVRPQAERLRGDIQRDLLAAIRQAPLNRRVEAQEP